MGQNVAEKPTTGEDGAVIVEASIALPIFMFMMITLYSIIQIAYVQARMSVAADAAAKQIAQYAHVYFATGMNESFSGKGGASSNIANKVGEFLTMMGNGIGTVNEELGTFIGGAGEAISGDSISTIFKDGAGETVALQMMKKNMVNGPSDTAEAFQKRNRIEDISAVGSKILTNDREIFLKISYDIKVIQLLKLDFKFHFVNCAYTEAWG